MSALDDEAFRFCHDAGAEGPAVRQWCELLAHAPPDACPGMRATCEGAWSADPLQCAAQACAPPSGLPGGAPETPVSWGEGCAQQESSCAPDVTRNVDVPVWLRWGVALTVVLLVAALARWVARWMGRWERPPAPMVAASSAPEDVPDRPAPDLLAEAEAARAGGRFAEAIERSRLATLRALGDAGLLRLHRARTDRDYRRELRADAVRGALLGIVLARAEAVRWARAVPVAADADAALSAARQLVTMSLLLLVATTAAAADRWAPDGDAALYDLLDEGWRVDGRPVAWRRLGADDHLVVLDADAVVLDVTDAEAVRDWVGRGGLLWVIGDPPEGLDHVVRGSISVRARLPLFHDLAIGARLPDGPARAFLDYAEGMAPLAFAPWWVVPTDTDDPIRCTEDDPCGTVAEGYIAPVATFLCEGRGAIGFVADRRVFANAAFVDPHNARALLQLLRSPVAACELDLPLEPVARIASSASGDVPPLEALRQARLLPAVAQLLAGWMLLAWSLGVPFGPPRGEAVDARREFADHFRALANRWRRGGATRWALARLASWWLARRGADGLTRDSVAAGWPPERLARHLAAWRDAAATPGAPGPSDSEHLEALWTLIRRR